MTDRSGRAVVPARIPLSGDDWQLKGYLGEDWRWRDAHKPGTRDTSGWISGRVPGTVHHDLWQAGQIADPYVGLNSLLCEWVPARTWLYKKRFTVDEVYRGSGMLLCFEGTDYEASFFLNGEELGHHCSMFTPVSFEVGDRLHYGVENVLAVVLEPAPHEQPQVGRSSLVRTHKTRMNYWWDFCPRLVHVGIWDEVYLRATGPVRLDRVAVSAQLDDELREAAVAIVVPVSSSGEQTVVLTTTISVGEAEIGRQETRYHIPAGGCDVQVSFTLARPELWWPNGYGAQQLYRVSVALDVDAAGRWQRSDERQARFGVRTIELVDNEGAPAGARPYTLAVNGRKIYMKGWNWVPLDVMYGVPRPEKQRRLLSLVQRAHANILRVWGGGLIEQEGFYDLCDELGILVWQEFIQSSSGIDNVPPADAGFLRFMEEEARQIVLRRRNHPSLAIWGGGNELQDEQGRPLDDSHPLLGLLHGTVEALDPGRAWLPTSPTGPCFGNAVENIEADPEGQHDVHGPWIYQGLEKQYTLANMGTSLLHSEFGVEGITNLPALEAVMAPEQRRPVRRDNPLWHHLGAWWVWEERWAAYFGDLDVLPLETVVRAVQFLQAEGLRYVVESNRRRWPRNSGSFPWQFNEPYPMAACTPAVDYFARPKPVYYAVARAYAPLSVTARFARIAWGGEEKFEAAVWRAGCPRSGVACFAEARVVNARGEVATRQTADFGWGLEESDVSGRGAELLTIEVPLADLDSDVFFLDLLLSDEGGQPLARNRYPFSKTENLAPLLALGETQLAVSGEQDRDEWMLVVENVGQVAALGVWLEAVDQAARVAAGSKSALPATVDSVYYDDNYFTLLPGERRTVRVTWADQTSDFGEKPDVFPERRLRISSANSAEIFYG